MKIDVSDHVIAEIISQYDNNENLRFVTYFSTKMLFVECNYEIYDKKLLTIIRAFELWRPEFEKTEQSIIVLSDHKNLEYFITIKLLNRRQARWSKFLFKFNFKIIYRFEGFNYRANAFIRQFEDLSKKKRDNRRQYQ